MNDSNSAAVTPAHVGLILDGNRRWAKAQGLPKLEGHKKGYENLGTIVDYAFSRGVQHISAYIFSTENWNRSKDEVEYLMGLLPIVFKKNLRRYIKDEVRIHWLGSDHNLSQKQRDLIQNALEKTKDFDKHHLSLCFNYGGRQEIVDAAKKAAEAGAINAAMTAEEFAQYLYEPEVPAIDLLIRTSGEQRLSNFMMWRSAYSELLFVPQAWPAFTIADFDDALKEYARRNRRFGG